MRTVSLTVLVLAATSACRDASTPSSRSVAEDPGAVVEPAAAPSVATPRAPAEAASVATPRAPTDAASVATPRAPADAASVATSADAASVATPPAGRERREPTRYAGTDDAPPLPADVDGLAVAWYDASLAETAWTLLCDSSASWVRHDIDSRTSCVPDGQTVHVLEPHGVEPWTGRRGVPIRVSTALIDATSSIGYSRTSLPTRSRDRRRRADAGNGTVARTSS